MAINFDQHKESYRDDLKSAVAFIGQDLDFFTGLKVGHLLETAKMHFGDLKSLAALDVGCGIGLTDQFLVSQLGQLHGVDIAKGVVEKAKNTNPSAHYQVYDGCRLPFADSTFDLTFSICVMEYVPPLSRKKFIEEMYRVTRTNGLIVIFQHNPFNPLTRFVIKRCSYDDNQWQLKKSEVVNLFIGTQIDLIEQRFVLFFPWRGKIFRKIESKLSWLPVGAQYFVAGKKL